MITIPSRGASPDIYLEAKAAMAEIDRAFGTAFRVPTPAVFNGDDEFSEFLSTWDHQVAAVLYELNRTDYGTKLNIYTDNESDLAPGLARLARLLKTRCVVDVGAGDADNSLVVFEPDGRVRTGAYRMTDSDRPGGEEEMLIEALSEAQ
jgi:hypothetical protein